jgi:hypothetical protein
MSDLERLHALYMASLRDMYFNKFASSFGRGQTNTALIEGILNECRSTMLLSTPERNGVAVFSFEGYLRELEMDMTQFSEERESMLARPNSIISRPPANIWRKRLRWFGGQLALLLVNMLQSEWHRRALQRAGERRLAEVPEFPLL